MKARVVPKFDASDDLDFDFEADLLQEDFWNELNEQLDKLCSDDSGTEADRSPGTPSSFCPFVAWDESSMVSDAVSEASSADFSHRHFPPSLSRDTSSSNASIDDVESGHPSWVEHSRARHSQGIGESAPYRKTSSLSSHVMKANASIEHAACESLHSLPPVVMDPKPPPHLYGPPLRPTGQELPRTPPCPSCPPALHARTQTPPMGPVSMPGPYPPFMLPVEAGFLPAASSSPFATSVPAYQRTFSCPSPQGSSSGADRPSHVQRALTSGDGTSSSGHSTPSPPSGSNSLSLGLGKLPIQSVLPQVRHTQTQPSPSGSQGTRTPPNEKASDGKFPVSEAGRCSHNAFWTRLRGKRHHSYFYCTYCGIGWRQPTREKQRADKHAAMQHLHQQPIYVGLQAPPPDFAALTTPQLVAPQQVPPHGFGALYAQSKPVPMPPQPGIFLPFTPPLNLNPLPSPSGRLQR